VFLLLLPLTRPKKRKKNKKNKKEKKNDGEDKNTVPMDGDTDNAQKQDDKQDDKNVPLVAIITATNDNKSNVKVGGDDKEKTEKTEDSNKDEKSSEKPGSPQKEFEKVSENLDTPKLRRSKEKT